MSGDLIKVFYAMAVPRDIAGADHWQQWEPDCGAFIFEEGQGVNSKVIQAQVGRWVKRYREQMKEEGFAFSWTYAELVEKMHPWMIEQWEEWKFVKAWNG